VRYRGVFRPAALGAAIDQGIGCSGPDAGDNQGTHGTPRGQTDHEGPVSLEDPLSFRKPGSCAPGLLAVFETAQREF
jgi:hypothetical protein